MGFVYFLSDEFGKGFLETVYSDVQALLKPLRDAVQSNTPYNMKEIFYSMLYPDQFIANRLLLRWKVQWPNKLRYPNRSTVLEDYTKHDIGYVSRFCRKYDVKLLAHSQYLRMCPNSTGDKVSVFHLNRRKCLCILCTRHASN